tara:strand:- start:247 stop:522 length:276 start_codon:yes stop_codon:yes gene_type:complete
VSLLKRKIATREFKVSSIKAISALISTIVGPLTPPCQVFEAELRLEAVTKALDTLVAVLLQVAAPAHLLVPTVLTALERIHQVVEAMVDIQ